MTTKNVRLVEIQRKETLTDAEMEELIKLRPTGTFKSLPNIKTLGVVDVQRAFHNFEEGPQRVKNALENECYIEVISLRLQHAEFWLRTLWVAKNGKGKIFEPTDKRTFGAIIGDCKVYLPSDLTTQLENFNQNRIDAIHKYLLGATDYNELRKVCDDSTGLDNRVGKYVRTEIGIVIQSILTGTDLTANFGGGNLGEG